MTQLAVNVFATVDVKEGLFKFYHNAAGNTAWQFYRRVKKDRTQFEEKSSPVPFRLRNMMGLSKVKPKPTKRR